jgi:hypothetical protein
VNLFAFFAYASFLFAMIYVLGAVLYWADQYLDPEDAAPYESTGRHAK